jgi:hypothetical protein
MTAEDALTLLLEAGLSIEEVEAHLFEAGLRLLDAEMVAPPPWWPDPHPADDRGDAPW